MFGLPGMRTLEVPVSEDGLKIIPFWKTSLLTGRTNKMDLLVDPETLCRWIDADDTAKPRIQEAFPHLTADEREFLLAGTTPREWEAVMGSGSGRSQGNGRNLS